MIKWNFTNIILETIHVPMALSTEKKFWSQVRQNTTGIDWKSLTNKEI